MTGLPSFARISSFLLATALVATAGPALADRAPPPRPDPKPVPRDVRDGEARDAAGAVKDDTAARDTTPPAEPAVKRLPNPRPTRLPDGLFLGRLEGAGGGAELQITIVEGRVTEAFIRRPGGLPVFDLVPVESGDAVALRLQGSVGSEFVRVSGAFFDAERGAGRFDGVLGRVKVEGTWVLARR